MLRTLNYQVFLSIILESVNSIKFCDRSSSELWYKVEFDVETGDETDMGVDAKSSDVVGGSNGE